MSRTLNLHYPRTRKSKCHLGLPSLQTVSALIAPAHPRTRRAFFQYYTLDRYAARRSFRRPRGTPTPGRRDPCILPPIAALYNITALRLRMKRVVSTACAQPPYSPIILQFSNRHSPIVTYHLLFPKVDSNSAEFPKSQNPHRATHLPMPAQTADRQESRPLRPRPSRPSG